MCGGWITVYLGKAGDWRDYILPFHKHSVSQAVQIAYFNSSIKWAEEQMTRCVSKTVLPFLSKACLLGERREETQIKALRLGGSRGQSIYRVFSIASLNSHHKGKGFSRGRELRWRPIFLSTEKLKHLKQTFVKASLCWLHHHLCFSCCHFISGTDSAQEHSPDTQLLNASAHRSSQSHWGSHSKSHGVQGGIHYAELQNSKNSFRKNDRDSLSLMKRFHTFSSKSCHGVRVVPLKTFNKKKPVSSITWFPLQNSFHRKLNPTKPEPGSLW